MQRQVRSNRRWIGGLVMSGVAALALTGCAQHASTPPTAAQIATADPASGPLATLAFLTGAWETWDGDMWTEEHWSGAVGDSMIGYSRALDRTMVGTERVGRLMFYEFLRIESRADGVYYLAAPKGRSPATAFKLIESGPDRMVFENPEHDFPRRITYRLENFAVLHAQIEGVGKDGVAKSSRWSYRRVEAEARK